MVGQKDELKFTIRSLKKEENSFLREIFYHVIYMPEGADPLPFSIVDHPLLIKYHQNWGRKGDIAMVAEMDGKLIGAAWCRLWKDEEKGYGFITNTIPELSMAILPDYRNHGIGKYMLHELFRAAKDSGYKAISLSVEKRNRAVSFYRRNGFKIVKKDSPDYLMQKDLESAG
jgi:GNAT superfamily N-acetyltransferase